MRHRPTGAPQPPPRRRLLPTPAPLFGLLLLALAPSIGAAGEPVRGDLPPHRPDIEQLLATDLDGATAAALLGELHELLHSRIGNDQISDAELYLGAMQGMIDVANRRLRAGESTRQASLPAATMLLWPGQAEALGSSLSGRMTGIGIEFQVHPTAGVLMVSRVLPGSPAERAAVAVGDALVGIDGQSTVGHPLSDVVGLLQGDADVALDLLRGNGMEAGRFRVTLAREPFDVRSVDDELQPDGLGYVRIHQLHERTPDELRAALQGLEQMGADRFVLDLRGTPGGSLAAAIEVADLFVPPGAVLLRTVEFGLGERDLVARRPAEFAEDLAILVDGWTRGAAEGLAAALQQTDRAKLIGEPTFGGGRVETLVPLGDRLVVRLDTVHLQTATGRSWAGSGVLPDTLVWDTHGGAPANGSLDPQYRAAVQQLDGSSPPRP